MARRNKRPRRLHPTLQRRKLRQREAQSLVQDPSAIGVPRLPDTESGLLTTTPNCLRGYYHHPNRMLMIALISIIAEGSAPGRQIWVTAHWGHVLGQCLELGSVLSQLAPGRC